MTTTPEAAPTASPADELAVLGQIMRRVAKLTPAGKVWLRDRLDAELGEG